MSFQTFFWDLDGTLFDTEPGIIKGYQYLCERMGVELPPISVLRTTFGPPVLVALERDFGMTPEQAEEGNRLFYEYFTPKGLFEAELYPGMIEALEVVREAGAQNYIATMKIQKNAEAMAQHFGMYALVGDVFGVWSADGVDTKKRILERGLAGTKANPAEAVMTGDRATDICAARELGMTTVGVTFGYARPGELEEAQPDYLAHDGVELREIVHGLLTGGSKS